MGLFDEVYVTHPLPSGTPEWLRKCPVFQTYDLGRGMGSYVFGEDKNLFMDFSYLGIEPTPPRIKVPYRRKRIELYASNIRGGRPDPKGGEYQTLTAHGEDAESVTMVLNIRDGKASLKLKDATRKPAHKE